MPIVNADLISVEEARQNRDDAQREMTRLLEDLDGAVLEIEQRHAGGPGDPAGPVYKAIRALAGILLRDTGGRADRKAGTPRAEKQTERILATFRQLPGGLRGEEAVLQAETCAVLAHACARRMADAAGIMADPRKAMTLNIVEHWTVQGELERIVEEFKARFPVYRGCGVEARPRFGDILVRLHCPPAKTIERAETPLRGLARELETFLAWELRKVGYNMEYEMNVFDTPENRLLLCRIDFAD